MEVADNKTQEWIRLFYGAHFLSAMCLVELMQVTWHILGRENLMDAKFTLRAGRAPGLNMHLVLLHMVKALCNDGDHVVIGKTVIHGFAFSAIFYKLTGPKYLQLMRNGRLGHS